MYEHLDTALAQMHLYSAELRNGNTNHGPMVAEALCALNCGHLVERWIAAYAKDDRVPRPLPDATDLSEPWMHTFATVSRTLNHGTEAEKEILQLQELTLTNSAIELLTCDWKLVLEQHLTKLAPGLSAAATHGVIRVGHAVRALAVEDTPARRAELADGLAYWTATYAELPHHRTADHQQHLEPLQAIQQVELVPDKRRVFEGSITSSFKPLYDTESHFADVINLIDVDQIDLQSRVIDIAETFVHVYIANAINSLTTIVLIHAVTNVGAVYNLLPHLSSSTARDTVRYSWQASCAMFATFASTVPHLENQHSGPLLTEEDLIERACAHGDDHVIKFVEVCIAFNKRRSSPAWFRAASRVFDFRPTMAY